MTDHRHTIALVIGIIIVILVIAFLVIAVMKMKNKNKKKSVEKKSTNRGTIAMGVIAGIIILLIIGLLFVYHAKPVESYPQPDNTSIYYTDPPYKPSGYPNGYFNPSPLPPPRYYNSVDQQYY